MAALHVLLALCAMSFAGAASGAKSRPNIVLLMSDVRRLVPLFLLFFLSFFCSISLCLSIAL